MSAKTATPQTKSKLAAPTGGGDYVLPPSSKWAGAWKTAAGLGVLGLAGAGAGFASDTRRFAFSYLFAFMLFLTMALGAMIFVLLQHLTSARWSVTVRRTAEFFMAGIPVFAILFVPIVLTMGELFPWLEPGEGAIPAAHAAALQEGESHGGAPAPAHDPHADPGVHPGPAADPHGATNPHGTPGMAPAGHGGADRAATFGAAGHGAGHDAAGHADPEHAEHEHILAKKRPYLNRGFFLLRAAFYFVVWTWVALTLFGMSSRQDTSKDPQLTVKSQGFAPLATILFSLTLTFAAFDWIMSLEPSWFSTIFGVNVFAASIVSILAMLIVVTMALRSAGHLKNAVTVEHFHDLGKLLFGFLIFWAYTGFSQFMLIWYAAIPEETTWYHHRWDNGPWATISLMIVIAKFIVPFFFLLSRNVKRTLPGLVFGAVWLLLMHALDIYWFVMPNYSFGDFSFHWLDIACVVGVGGIYLAAVFFRMSRHPLIPIGDPRLDRSLHFENA